MHAKVVYSVNHCKYWIREHANNLRAEVAEETANPTVVDTFVTKVANDWKIAGMNYADRFLCFCRIVNFDSWLFFKKEHKTT